MPLRSDDNFKLVSRGELFDPVELFLCQSNWFGQDKIPYVDTYAFRQYAQEGVVVHTEIEYVVSGRPAERLLPRPCRSKKRDRPQGLRCGLVRADHRTQVDIRECTVLISYAYPLNASTYYGDINHEVSPMFVDCSRYGIVFQSRIPAYENTLVEEDESVCGSTGWCRDGRSGGPTPTCRECTRIISRR